MLNLNLKLKLTATRALGGVIIYVGGRVSYDSFIIGWGIALIGYILILLSVYDIERKLDFYERKELL